MCVLSSGILTDGKTVSTLRLCAANDIATGLGTEGADK